MQNNLFFEMLPLIGFFAVYYFTKNIYLATGICIILSWLQLLLYKIIYKRIGKNTWLSTLLITVFGGLTIIFHNKTFVMLKPSVLYWIMAVSLLVSAKMGKNGIKLLLNEHFTLSEKDWGRVNLMWVAFFILMGILNLVVAYSFSEYIWVKFKVFGGFGLMLLFTIISGLFIYSKTSGVQNEL